MFEQVRPGQPSVLFHLHPALVEKPSDPDEEATVILCGTCFETLRKKRMPKYSIMKGYDYGYLVGMPVLSILERTLIARYSCFGTVVKLNKWKATRQLALTGHIITFPHSAPEAVLLKEKAWPWHGEKIFEYVRVAFVGPTEMAEWCLRVLCLPSGPLRANVRHMLKWLDLLKRINQYYRDIVIPTLEEAQRLDRKSVV